MTKVLIATHFFPPNHLGGTEVLTLGLAKGLIAKGCDVEVVCNEGWNTAPSYRITEKYEHYQGIPVHRLYFNWQKAPNVFRYLYNNPEVYKYFKAYIKFSKPDVFHITSCYSLSASIISAAYEMGIKIILTATDFWFICSKNTLLRNDGELCPGQESSFQCTKCLSSNQRVFHYLSRFFPEKLLKPVVENMGRLSLISNLPGFRGMWGDWESRFAFMRQSLEKVNKIVTASHFLKELFIQQGIPSDMIVFSSYGLDTTWSKGYETKIKSSCVRVGFIGQITPEKGPDLLIRAVRSLTQFPNLQLKIYGDLKKVPYYGEELRTLAGNDSRIYFLGTFDNSKMGEVLSDLDVLVVPSIWYDFPLVIPSAFATRTPVIATNLPGMNELVQDRVNGFLFNRGDWMDLASKIRLLVENPEYLDKLIAGINPVKTIEEMVDEYLRYYERL